MRLNVAENAVRTSLYGIINKTIMIILPFIVRTIMIKEIGAEYIGLNGLFTSLLQVLNLTELGFGSAMIFSMYQPIANNERETICALMNFYKKTYHMIGIAVLCVGMIVLLFIDNLVSGEVPAGISLRILFGVYLLNTVLGYFLYAYKSFLFYAHQRYDIYNNIQTGLNFVNYIYQAVVLIFFKNYYVYIITLPIVTILLNIISARFADKMYPMYQAKGELNEKTKSNIKKRVLALAGHKIGGGLSNSCDNLVISYFLGITALAMYSNYFYIINSLNGFMLIATNALTAGIGNQIVNDDKEKVYNNFIQVSCLISTISGWCTICILCLTQPFMNLWAGEELMLGFGTVIYMSIYFYIWTTRYIISIYKDANGMWKADVLKPYVEGVVNLSVNIILVKNFGINGVLLSTIFSMILIGIPWETRVLFKEYFEFSEVNYYLRRLLYAAITIVALLPTYWVSSLFAGSGISGLLCKGAVCVILPTIMVGGLSYTILPEFRWVLKRLKQIVVKKARREIR